MSKTRNNQLNNDANASSEETTAIESSSMAVPPAEPMAVVKQEAVHEANVNNTQAALQPGRTFTPSNDLLGEIESLIHTAETNGDQALAAELHNVMIKIGDLLSHIGQLEKDSKGSIKALYTKVISFFRK